MMNIKTMKNGVTTAMGRKAFALSKNSPHIMFGAGVVGVVGTVVLASRATLRVEDVLNETAGEVHEVHRVSEAHPDKYSDNDRKRDLTVVYARSAGKLAKLYAPSVILGVASIGLLTKAHVTLNKRHTSAVAAFAAVDKAFKQYRERVAEDLGEEKEREYYHGVQEREVYSEKKNGEPVVSTVKHAAGYSIYSRIFDVNHNKNAHPEPSFNIFWLRSKENYLNDQLQANGHVFLNDVYRELGFEDTPAGALCGWIKGEGDNHIDFGMWGDDKMESVAEFMRGTENAIVLDFNVDGEIWNRI